MLKLNQNQLIESIVYQSEDEEEKLDTLYDRLGQTKGVT